MTETDQKWQKCQEIDFNFSQMDQNWWKIINNEQKNDRKRPKMPRNRLEFQSNGRKLMKNGQIQPKLTKIQRDQLEFAINLVIKENENGRKILKCDWISKQQWQQHQQQWCFTLENNWKCHWEVDGNWDDVATWHQLPAGMAPFQTRHFSLRWFDLFISLETRNWEGISWQRRVSTRQWRLTALPSITRRSRDVLQSPNNSSPIIILLATIDNLMSLTWIAFRRRRDLDLESTSFLPLHSNAIQLLSNSWSFFIIIIRLIIIL